MVGKAFFHPRPYWPLGQPLIPETRFIDSSFPYGIDRQLFKNNLFEQAPLHMQPDCINTETL